MYSEQYDAAPVAAAAGADAAALQKQVDELKIEVRCLKNCLSAVAATVPVPSGTTAAPGADAASAAAAARGFRAVIENELRRLKDRCLKNRLSAVVDAGTGVVDAIGKREAVAAIGKRKAVPDAVPDGAASAKRHKPPAGSAQPVVKTPVECASVQTTDVQITDAMIRAVMGKDYDDFVKSLCR